MGKKILTQDERALKFFFDKSAETEFKFNRRGAKVVALIENHEDETFSLIEVQLKNGERWTMKHDVISEKYTFAHYCCEGDTVPLTAEVSAPVVGEVVDLEAKKAAAEVVENINRELHGVLASFCRIGFEFVRVRDGELYKFHDCKNVSEFGAKFFELKKASVYNYIAVCEKFSRPDENGKPTAEIADAFKAYSFSQLCEMLRLGADALALCSPDMSCKEIRALGAAALNSGEDSEDSGSAGEPENCTDFVNLFSRTLTPALLTEVITMLKENFGRVINIEVEIPIRNGEIVPADAV